MMKYLWGIIFVLAACNSGDREASTVNTATKGPSTQLEQPVRQQRPTSGRSESEKDQRLDAEFAVVEAEHRQHEDRSKDPLSYQKIPSTPVSAKPPHTLDEFAGADACKSCHLDIYNDWSQSSHGLAGGSPNPETIVAPFDGTPMTFADAVVTPRKKGNRYYFEVREGNADPVTMDVVGVVGRGLMKGGGTQVFLNRSSDGRVLMLPFDYSVSDQKWFCQAKRGKGWEHIDKELRLRDCEYPPWRGLGITGGPNCQNCHVSQVEVTWQGIRGDFVTRWQSLTIDCESCHGPAQAHVNAKKVNSASGAMPSLKGLTERDSLDLCFRCHATKSVTGPGYQSGQDFNEHFSHTHMMDSDFTPLDEQGRVREFAYQEGHLSSPCYAKGAMVCTDCHTPHGLGYQDVFGHSLSDWRDDRQCTGCHVGVAVSPKLHGKHPSDVRCVQCHMPYVQHPGVGAEVTYARSDHRISRPVEWQSGRALAGGACQRCHSWTSDLEREKALSSIYGKVRAADARIASLIRLEAFDMKMGYLRAEPLIGRALSLLAGTLDWGVQKRVRILTTIGQLLLVPGGRHLTERELSELSTLMVASPFEVKAAGGAILLLLSDIQPAAGTHFDRVLATVPTQKQVGFRRAVAFNLIGLWMSYGFSNRGVTERLVRVIRRFAPQLESDGPRIEVFAGRTLGAVGATEASFRAYLDALSDPTFYGTPVTLDKGGDPRAIFGEMKNRFMSDRPDLIAGILERLPPFLARMPENMMLRCGAFEAKQQLQQALDCVTRIVEENPRVGIGHFKRADLLLKLRRQAKAIEALEKGLAIDPDDREAKDLYRFLRMKNWEKAR